MLVLVLICCLPFLCLWWQMRKYQRRKEQPVGALTPGNPVDVKSVEPKPNPKPNFVSKHWRGEYSLPRSFWIHGVLLGYLLLVVSCVLMESRLYPGSPFFSMISMIGIGIWQIGGVLALCQTARGFLGKGG